MFQSLNFDVTKMIWRWDRYCVRKLGGERVKNYWTLLSNNSDIGNDRDNPLGKKWVVLKRTKWFN